jgi:2-oxoisovalerate ferredoxin oxidoreductase beta subunit
VENQVRGLGFSLVEVLSPCPTIWKLDPVEAQRFVREEMAPTFPVANFRDRTAQGLARPEPLPPPPLDELPRILGLENGHTDAAVPKRLEKLDLRIKVAGFGGQGVLMVGEVLAEAGLDAGYEVSWLPSYGPEMRSGTSNCTVRLSAKPIDSPLVSRLNVLLALNEPSLRKFLPNVEPGGVVLYNGDAFPEDCARTDVRGIAVPFTRLADGLGASKAGNVVMLGALLEITDMLEQERVTGALRRLVKSDRWYELDLAALEMGREEARRAPSTLVDENYLWGV